jgi:transmembrane sensor
MENNNDYGIELLTRCLTGNSSESEKHALLTWLNQDKENEVVYFRMKDIYEAGAWDKLLIEADTVKEWDRLYPKIHAHANSSDKKSIPHRHWTFLLKYAAILIFGVLLTLIVQKINNLNTPVTLTKVFTGKGERTRLVLPDGTRIFLNSCSSLTYAKDFGKKSRQITLSGEAYFEVKKNSKLPFIVDALGNHIKVLGTSFNVSADPEDDDVSAVLVEGSVSFENEKSHTIQIIKPGQKISYHKPNFNITIEDVDTELYTSWTTGEYRFEKESILNIAKQLQRNYNVTFIVKNEKILKIPFTGTFKNYESLDQILKVIKTNTSIKYQIVNDTVFIK